MGVSPCNISPGTAVIPSKRIRHAHGQARSIHAAAAPETERKNLIFLVCMKTEDWTSRTSSKFQAVDMIAHPIHVVRGCGESKRHRGILRLENVREVSLAHDLEVVSCELQSEQTWVSKGIRYSMGRGSLSRRWSEAWSVEGWISRSRIHSAYPARGSRPAEQSEEWLQSLCRGGLMRRAWGFGLRGSRSVERKALSRTWWIREKDN